MSAATWADAVRDVPHGPARREGDTVKPEVTQRGVLDMQVCVPTDWTDEQAKAFADAENCCGTQNGWQVCKAGCSTLNGAPERVPCAERAGFVHIRLDA